MFTEEDIKNIVDNYETDMLADLDELISIPSVSNNKEEVIKALEWVISKGESFGFSTSISPNKLVGIIDFGEGEETIGTLVHVDVVPPGEDSLWKSDPFKMKIENGCIYGRGAYDNKGSVISALYAMKSAKDLLKNTNKKIRLIVGTEEEVLWTDMDEYEKYYDFPDYGFTPDGGFPLQNSEKGYMDIQMAFPNKKDEGKDFEYEIRELSAGHSKNTVPETAKVILVDRDNNEKEIQGKGVSAHSSEPEKGVNALWEIVKNQDLKNYSIADNGASNVLKMIKEVFAEDYYGKNLGFTQEDYHNDAFVHKTTVTPTYLRTDGDEIILNFNLRTRFDMTREKIEECFKELAQKYGATNSEIVDYDVPVYVDPEAPFVKEMAKSYEKETGLTNKMTLNKGTTYAKAMPNIVIWGPLEEGGNQCAHKANEHIKVETLKMATRVYTDFYCNAMTLKEKLNQ